MNKKITVIIPARGGSKRLHKKNIAPIWGKPMLCWVIAAAEQSKYINDIWVSTEDDDIAQIAIRCGSYLHRRSSELSKDNVFKMEAIRDTVGYLEDNDMSANI